jgi:hypothetical protein
MRRFIKYAVFVALFLIMRSTAAMAEPDFGGNGGGSAVIGAWSGPTQLEIVQVSPGVAKLVFTSASVVRLNEADTSGANLVEKDWTNKGQSTVYHGDNPKFAGAIFALTTAGPGWAGPNSEAKIGDRFNLNKMYTAPLNSGGRVEVLVTVKEQSYKKAGGTTFGVIPVAVNEKGEFLGWISHPEGDSQWITNAVSGRDDLQTVIHVDESGTFSKATQADLKQAVKDRKYISFRKH